MGTEISNDNIECKSCLLFKILLILIECWILLMGNTVEMQGGDIDKYETGTKATVFST